MLDEIPKYITIASSILTTIMVLVSSFSFIFEINFERALKTDKEKVKFHLLQIITMNIFSFILLSIIVTFTGDVNTSSDIPEKTNTVASILLNTYFQLYVVSLFTTIFVYILISGIIKPLATHFRKKNIYYEIQLTNLEISNKDRYFILKKASDGTVILVSFDLKDEEKLIERHIRTIEYKELIKLKITRKTQMEVINDLKNDNQKKRDEEQKIE